MVFDSYSLENSIIIFKTLKNLQIKSITNLWILWYVIFSFPAINYLTVHFYFALEVNQFTSSYHTWLLLCLDFIPAIFYTYFYFHFYSLVGGRIENKLEGGEICHILELYYWILRKIFFCIYLRKKAYLSKNLIAFLFWTENFLFFIFFENLIIF